MTMEYKNLTAIICQESEIRSGAEYLSRALPSLSFWELLKSFRSFCMAIKPEQEETCRQCAERISEWPMGSIDEQVLINCIALCFNRFPPDMLVVDAQSQLRAEIHAERGFYTQKRITFSGMKITEGK